MSGRLEMALVALVMAAAGLILVAPVLGRSGAPAWADVVMLMAAGAGGGAFVLVAIDTFRATRRHRPEGKKGES
jgi:hypothetical protein